MPQSKVTRFSFSVDRKRYLAGLLERVKPRLPKDRITFFLFECEREIYHCFRGFPAGWQPDLHTPKRLEAVGKAAMALVQALANLNEAERLSIFAGTLVGHYSGFDLPEVSAEAREMNGALLKIHAEANHLCHGSGTPANVRLAEDIAHGLARSYVTAFEALPSLRHDGIYTEFVREISGNDLPGLYRVTIGKRTMDLANKRAAVHLDCIQMNKTVTEIQALQGKSGHG